MSSLVYLLQRFARSLARLRGKSHKIRVSPADVFVFVLVPLTFGVDLNADRDRAMLLMHLQLFVFDPDREQPRGVYSILFRFVVVVPRLPMR